MTPERWHQITKLFHEAADRPADQREAWLAEACGVDVELRERVAALLIGDADRSLDEAQLAVACDEPPRLTSGIRLGPYEIERLIAAGGMGEVYAGHDTRLERAVAIKVLPHVFELDGNLGLRFDREARAISRLTHPHICTLYDVGEHAGRFYLVMERLEGVTLAERIAKGPLAVAEALDISLQVLEALEHAHRQGIVHRDVKPANVMLTAHGVKLLDFGIANGIGDASDGVIAGTPDYMAPEQFGTASADARIDIFAFGVVLREMLTGQRGVAGAPSLAIARPDVPVRLERLVEACLERDPARRCSDAAQALVELRAITDATTIRQAREPPGRPAQPADAYGGYGRAVEFLKSDLERDLRAAIALLERATEIDPPFAGAHAKLGYAHALLWWHGYDRSAERKTQAYRAIEAAAALDREAAEVHKALGFYRYWCEGDFTGGLREFEAARAHQPDDPEILFGIAAVWRRQGRPDLALPLHLESAALDPENAVSWQNLALTYAMLRRPADADAALVRATQANPQFLMGHALRAHWCLRLAGDVEQAREVLLPAINLALAEDSHLRYAMVLTELHGRVFDAALQQVAWSASEAFSYQTWYVPKPLLEGQILAYCCRKEAAQDAFRRAVALLEDRLQVAPGEPRLRAALGLAYAGLGRKEDAIAQGERAVSLEPVSRDALRGPYRVQDLAHIYALVGEADAAVERLEYLMEIPYDLAPAGLRLDPAWDSLRGHPSFRRLVE